MYNTWSRETIKSSVKLIRSRHMDHGIMWNNDRLKDTPNVLTKVRKVKKGRVHERKIKFGMEIPSHVRHAIDIDKTNKNQKWGEAISKEMDALERLGCFEFLDPGTVMKKEDRWQYAPLRVIFDIRLKISDIKRGW